jgi:hypothetical protein
MSQTKTQLFDVSVEGPTALKNGAFDVTIGASGNLTISDGNLVVANGHGIDFSATADSSGTTTSELLDNYEEGTWTPTELNGSVGAITVGFAKYTRFGNIVYCYFDITYPINAIGGNASFSVPFSMANTSHYGGGIAGWSSNGDGCKFHVGADRIYSMKLETGSAAGNIHLSPANLSNQRLLGQVMYEAA